MENNLKIKEIMVKHCEDCIKDYVDSLIKKSKMLTDDLMRRKKLMDDGKHNIIAIFEMAIDEVERNWNLSKALSLTYSYMRAKEDLEIERRNK